jgi:hypothetical protein
MPITSIEQVTDTGTLHDYLLWIKDQLANGKMRAVEAKRRVAQARRRLAELKTSSGNQSSDPS